MRPFRVVLSSVSLLALTASSAFARNPTELPVDAAYRKAFRETILARHNEYRARHGVPPLKWSDSIAKYAASRAKTRAQQDGLSAGHSGLAPGYGENLYWGGSSGAGSAVPAATDAAERATKSWYDEIKDYDYKNPTFSPKVGHFTQMIWKNTTEVGCAVFSLKGSQWLETYVACEYQPPGNVMGQFSANVPPPKKKG